MIESSLNKLDSWIRNNGWAGYDPYDIKGQQPFLLLYKSKYTAFASEKLLISPEQVQIFTPTPSTYSTLMYYTEIDPFTGKKIFVEKDINKKIKQKDILTEKKRKLSSSLGKSKEKKRTRR